MAYETITIKKALSRINNENNEPWFLPAIQRPYVWGDRTQSEKYICKLFDSILRGYPIGTIIIWNTDKEVEHRPFATHYVSGKEEEFELPDKFGRKDKYLVYDGQQRLQTLYSCLNYTINGRKLIYNLFFDLSADISEDVSETGFKFIPKDEQVPLGCIAMAEIYKLCDDDKTEYRIKLGETLKERLSDNKNRLIFETNIDKLWSSFVKEDGTSSLGKFQIEKEWKEEKVNDVFQRLNSGGVALSNADLLLSKIKEIDYKFESNLRERCVQLHKLTGGWTLSPIDILNILFYLIQGTYRVDPARIKKNQLQQFIDVFEKLKKPLDEFAIHFIKENFNINDSRIIPTPYALLPLIVFVYAQSLKKKSYSDISDDDKIFMKKYFILSQVNSWNTDGIVQGVSTIFKDDSPLIPSNIYKLIESKNRILSLSTESLENSSRFVLKILTPKTTYVSSDAMGRYKPELDHIFPKSRFTENDITKVDVLWNLQPVTGDINGKKSKTLPKDFFKAHPDYYKEYSFVPKDKEDALWDNHIKFIEFRKKKMIDFLNEEYDLKLSDWEYNE